MNSYLNMLYLFLILAVIGHKNFSALCLCSGVLCSEDQLLLLSLLEQSDRSCIRPLQYSWRQPVVGGPTGSHSSAPASDDITATCKWVCWGCKGIGELLTFGYWTFFCPVFISKRAAYKAVQHKRASKKENRALRSGVNRPLANWTCVQLYHQMASFVKDPNDYC